MARNGQPPWRACRDPNRPEWERRTDARGPGKITFVCSFILARCLQNEHVCHEEPGRFLVCSFNWKTIYRKWGKPDVHFLISNNKENYENDSLRSNVSDNLT